jgi:hypothetical protein
MEAIFYTTVVLNVGLFVIAMLMLREDRKYLKWKREQDKLYRKP